MKILLSGYEGSKRILAASSYLVNKYLPGFNVYWLNYGEYSGKLFCGTYTKLKNKQESKENWSSDIKEYLLSLEDEYIIFTLDDYLLSSPAKEDLPIGVKDGLINLCSDSNPDDKSYSVTTQYTIWDRELLIRLLGETTTPWDFEINGSRILNSWGIKTEYKPLLEYPHWSSLSSKWYGVDTKANNQEDILYLKSKGYL